MQGISARVAAVATLSLALASTILAGKAPSGNIPAAPSNLAATLTGPNTVQLTWADNAGNELQFSIERSLDAFKSRNMTKFSVGPNVLFYEDTSVLGGKTYSYRVRAVNKAGSSAPSNVETVPVPVPPPPPAAPSGLVAVTASASTGIWLGWADNSNDETGFKLERASSGLATVEISLPSNTREYTDSGLASGRLYTYRVRACTPEACSSYSNAAAANTGLDISDWQDVFQGIKHATGLCDVPGSPRQVVNVLQVDLKAPGIQFYSTGPSANYRPEVEETTGMTTSAWLLRHGMQAAINGNWFYPCCTAQNGTPEELYGLALSDGDTVSAQESLAYSTTLLISSLNETAIVDQNFPTHAAFTVNTAVAGKNAVLSGGRYVGTTTTFAPRTAVGMTADRQFLLLMTIDGRQPGYSDGAADADTAAWMLRFGAADAFNLDGGGSTTMAVSDGAGKALVLNKPIHADTPGMERAVANHLGVRALPLPVTSGAALARVPGVQLDPASEQISRALVDASVDPTPLIIVTPLGQGQHRIHVAGLPDYTYEVQFRKPGTVDWRTLFHAHADDTGAVEVIDQADTVGREYRAIATSP